MPIARVSVIIPTYNRTKFLQEALESVLGQTRPVNEIIIVNDGSDNEYLEDLENLSSLNNVIRRIDNPCNYGVSYSRNRGISASSGDYLIFLDDDDVLGKFFVEKSREILDSKEDVDATISWTEVLPSGKKGRKNRLMADLLKSRREYYAELSVKTLSFFLIHCPMVHSFMFKREVFINHQFPEDLKYGEDIFLWIEMCKTGVRFEKLNVTGSYVRLHNENVTDVINFEEKNKFYKRLETSGLVNHKEEYHIHAMRTFYFKLANWRMPSLQLLRNILRSPMVLIRFTWLYIKVTLRSI